MTPINEIRGVDSEQSALDRKLEFAIISVLFHYDGQYKEEMVEWYSALRLGLPQLTDQRQLRNAFESLAKKGFVELADFPDAPADPRTDDRSLSRLTAFTATMTTAGLSRWDALRFEAVGAVAV